MNRYEVATASLLLAAPRALDRDDRRSRRAVAAWLFVCCALVFAMVVVGGVTRLTHSGLSITEWQPIVGTLPPLTDAQWEAAFAKYRATPEYRLVNHAMDLAGFKGIFWWEYFHRLLGRMIGVVFLVPLAWFAVRRQLPRPLCRNRRRCRSRPLRRRRGGIRHPAPRRAGDAGEAAGLRDLVAPVVKHYIDQS